jgi:NAD(P)-dependent dehydrogenase (short-subunit alcohol dehydrogenase family)
MRSILITGANKGIGLAIAEAVLSEHADTFVYLGARDVERGRAAARGLPQDRVKVVPLDVTSDASVVAAREQVEGLHALVNNAGVGYGSSFEAVMQTNILGLQRACATFLPLIARDGRIVNVTSAAGPSYVADCPPAQKALLLDPELEWPRLQAFVHERLQTAPSTDGADAYGLSKACANAYTVLLAREHPELQVNACTPGFIDTDLTRSLTATKSAAELGMKTPAEGARSTLHLLFEKLEGNGRYYGSDSKRSPLDRYRSPGSPEYTG